MASAGDNEVSADLAGFTDPEAEEVVYWQRVEREALTLCEPLARMIGHKRICAALDVSKGQLSRELNTGYENNLSLLTGLYILRSSQNEKLARLLVCDGAGMRMPEWQRRQATPEEWKREFEAECRDNGALGESFRAAVARRVKGGR